MADFSHTRVSTAGMKPVLATVQTTVTSGMCDVTIGDTTTTVQVARGLSVSVGDVVILQRIGAIWFATALAFTAAPAAVNNEPAPVPKPVAVKGTLVVSPVETRSYRSNFGWRTDNDDVYQGEYGGWGNHTGCVFYGGKPRSLAGAVVDSASIKVERVSAGVFASQTSTLWLLTDATRPSGAPSLNPSHIAGPALPVGGSGVFAVPASWVQAMVNGSAGGLAVYDFGGSPYMRFAGRGSWSPAWTMTINWSR